MKRFLSGVVAALCLSLPVAGQPRETGGDGSFPFRRVTETSQPGSKFNEWNNVHGPSARPQRVVERAGSDAPPLAGTPQWDGFSEGLPSCSLTGPLRVTAAPFCHSYKPGPLLRLQVLTYTPGGTTILVRARYARSEY